MIWISCCGIRKNSFHLVFLVVFKEGLKVSQKKFLMKTEVTLFFLVELFNSFIFRLKIRKMMGAYCFDTWLQKSKLSALSSSEGSYILRRPENFAKSSPYFWLALHRTKVRWRFRKILWPSQNIWTLNEYIFEIFSFFVLLINFF